MEGFIEEVSLVLGLKEEIRLHQAGGTLPKLQFQFLQNSHHPLATLSCDIGLDRSI